MHAAQLLTGRLAGIVLALLLASCTNQVHTLESTSRMSREELSTLCADLEIRAAQDCDWNMRDRQSAIEDSQTWEVNCRARRDSARESYENVCMDARTRPAE